VFKKLSGLFRTKSSGSPEELPDDEEVTIEQIERKNRSIEILKREKVPFIDWLPVIESEAESVRRTDIAVLRRAIALSIVAEKPLTKDPEFIFGLIERFDIDGDFTPWERKFVYDKNPSEQNSINATWRMECVYILLWSLGLFELTRPAAAANNGETVAPMATIPYEELVQKIKLRPQSEILDQADLIYRYHWATKNASNQGRKIPEGLNHSVVMERHRAFNWLVGYLGQDWDDITLDT